MKRKFICSMILILFTISVANFCYAESAESAKKYYSDNGRFNGRYWNMLSKSEKSSYITGVQEGIGLCAELEFAYVEAGEQRELRTKILKSLDIYVPKKLIVEEIIKYIDDFYLNQKDFDTAITTVYVETLIKHDAKVEDRIAR